MKNNYRKLKLSILLQTVFITALTVLVGRFILEYFIDGIYNDSFANGFLRILEAFHVSEETATSLYWQWIGNNKVFFMILGFLLLFSLFFYVALSKMTRYLEQVEDGIENIISASDQPIRLITELKPIEDRLNEIKETLRSQEEEAEKLEQRKNDVLLFLAHDLKTPLTSVVAYLSMLDSHPEMPAEDRAKYTQISLEKANRLGDLLKEFFESIKLNLQDIELDKVDIDLTMMLEQIADELYGVLQEKMLTCKVEAEEEILIEGDPDKLARVFDNILRNAIAYCREKSVLLIQAAKEENQVRICFENEGDTIPEESLKRIFDKFYRADASRSSSTGGAGLGLAIAKNIVAYREENGPFTSRKQILKVPKLGPKAFEQCAGFLRVPESRSVLDNTAVHPESYAAAEKLLSLTGHTLTDVRDGKLGDLNAQIRTYGEDRAAADCGVGVPTLRDVAAELMKPGRDIRDELPKPILRTDVLEMKDLKPGMVLTGTVRNVIDFGVFVDIGVHQDGLVHISQVSQKFIKHPSEVVSVGDIVQVVVLEVDEKKKRIGLSMKQVPKA